MIKRKVKSKNSKTQKSRIPEFRSREEEAKWFDTHDMADYQDEFKTVPARFSKNLSHAIAIRFDSETLEKLRVRARKKGLGPTTLARMWIIERLEEGERRR